MLLLANPVILSMCLGLAVIPHTLLFILFLHPFDEMDESFLALKAHLSVKSCVIYVFNNTRRNLLCIFQIRLCELFSFAL